MKTKFLKNALVAGVILSASIAGTAQADALASSVVDITDLKFTQSDGTILDYSNFNPVSFTNSSGVAASLNTVEAAGNEDSALGAVETDFFAEIGSNPGYADNDFTDTLLSSASGLPSLPAPGYSYAISDQLETGSPIANYPNPKYDPTQPIDPLNNPEFLANPAHIANGAFAGLSTTAIGSADNNNQLDSTFTFSGISGIMKIKFDMAYYLEAFIDTTDIAPTKAAADYSFNMEITRSWDGLVMFQEVFADGVARTAPTGFGLQTGLNLQAAPANPPTRLTVGVFDSFSFSGDTLAFNADEEYQLNFRINTNADVTNIPEPGVLALLGLGLVGIGFTRRRAK